MKWFHWNHVTDKWKPTSVSMIFPISLLPLVVNSGRVAGQLLIVSKNSPDWAGRKPGREPFSTFAKIFHYSKGFTGLYPMHVHDRRSNHIWKSRTCPTNIGIACALSIFKCWSKSYSEIRCENRDINLKTNLNPQYTLWKQDYQDLHSADRTLLSHVRHPCPSWIP